MVQPLEPPIEPPPYRPVIVVLAESMGLHYEPELSDAAHQMLNDRDDAIRRMTCINPPLGCGTLIMQDEFNRWDASTRQEYRQSGWCRTCQDKIFVDPDNDPDRCICDDEPCCSVDVGIGTIYCNHRDADMCPQHGMQPPDEEEMHTWGG